MCRTVRRTVSTKVSSRIAELPIVGSYLTSGSLTRNFSYRAVRRILGQCQVRTGEEAYPKVL